MNNKFKLNFSFTLNIVFLVFLFLGGLVWADTNGIWHLAEDVRPGIFGSDEGIISGYSFVNPLSLNSDTTYKGVELDTRFVNEAQVTSVGSSMIVDGSVGIVDVNSAQVQARVSDSCSAGSSIRVINFDGTVSCEVDELNDADSVIGNEYPLAGTGILVSTRTVSVDTNIVATKNYVDSVAGGSSIPSGVIVMWSGSIATIPTGWVLCDGTNGAPNLKDRFVIAAGGSYAVGATSDGSIPSHSHGAGSLATYSAGLHSHSDMVRTEWAGSGLWAAAMIDGREAGTYWGTGKAGAHTHTITGETGVLGTGTKVIATYYALAYIMKQ